MILDLVKQYSRVDFKEDDLLLSSLISQAEEYIKNATGHEVTYERELEKLAVCLLVNHYYDERGIVSHQQVNKLPHSIESVLQQLEFCYE
ncbi:head-tail connector protein [Evansella cellulosilytica]|uniref:Uncharacterized phage protein (Putative DNA packaging) n=1 Tax=Evansella cellulosilytica (strain ATCC 21833 / DSM 2522 / FERM P-1141 / JCM 9156 / N-4) TaxID=649639 RepID=E6U1J7_EVAC2|nr:head-tail connector protein [Evansella cellulosilytica]ADU30360.1 uncharacterized phage protein (putative DNA packaging) [Evansella cellulosilytica DSM 2522]